MQELIQHVAQGSSHVIGEPVANAIIPSDGVIREHGTGKLSLIGCFTQFNCQTFPFSTPGFFITVCATNLQNITGEVTFTVRAEIPDTGHVMASSSARIGLAPDHKPPPTAILQIPLRIQPFQVDGPGPVEIKVLLEGEEIGKTWIAFNSTTGITDSGGQPQ